MSLIDTTCVIWEIERETMDTPLTSHDQEVYITTWGGDEVYEKQPFEGGLDPILAYTARAEIEQLKWLSLHPDWVVPPISFRFCGFKP